MSLDFGIGACSAKAVLFGGDDGFVDGAGATRRAMANALCKRGRRVATFQPEAARAVTVTASSARWRRLAPFAKEISQ
jgi:hypothetical protein